MKISTLTYHGAHNYGSVLQAYALSKQLQLMGNDVEIINLRPESQKSVYNLNRKPTSLPHRVLDFITKRQRTKRFSSYERFINSVLPITDLEYASTKELVNADLNFDAYICGSDQIWNPVCPDFETAYYLQFLTADCKAKRISYAASFGKSDFDEETEKQIGDWVKDFDNISVRELKGQQLVQRVSNKDVSIVCDPVVLLDRKYWDELAVDPKIKEPYMLVYFLENNHGNKGFIDELSKTLGLKVVVLTEYLRDIIKPYKKKYDASPEEFVGLFKNASFIYTNSFHGTAFATIYNKPFISVIDADQENAVNNNDSRKIDYLNLIGLQDRLVKNDLPSKDELMHCDYTNANEKMREFKEYSHVFLSNALGE